MPKRKRSDKAMELADKLESSLSLYKKDLHNAKRINPSQFDIHQIATMIRSIPERKWRAAESRAQAMTDKKLLANELKVLRATKMLEAGGKRDKLSSADDRKAWVESQQEIIDLDTELIFLEAAQLSAELAYECLDDLFTAGKKTMEWLTDQERATQQYSRFNNEGKGNVR